MNLAQIIGSKLIEVQKQHNFSQQEMADIIGVTRQTMSKYLNGDKIIDSDKLYHFAQYFQKPIEYFLNVNVDSFNVSFLFRADDPANNFTDQLRDSIAGKFNTYYSILKLNNSRILEYVPEEYRLNLTGSRMSDEDSQIIEQIAQKQRKYMGIDDAINVNVFRLLESNNIHILAEPVEELTLDALSAYSEEKGAFIFINDLHTIPEERKVFSLIHEFGHLIFHRSDYSKEPADLKYSKNSNDLREKVADYFASCFLIPRAVLVKNYMRLLRSYISLETVLSIKEEFGVSTKTLLRALYSYDLISRSTYNKLCQDLINLGYDTAEPAPCRPFIRKNEKYFTMVKLLAVEDKLSTNRVAELLHMDLKEARLKVKEWKSCGSNEN